MLRSENGVFKGYLSFGVHSRAAEASQHILRC